VGIFLVNAKNRAGRVAEWDGGLFQHLSRDGAATTLSLVSWLESRPQRLGREGVQRAVTRAMTDFPSTTAHPELLAVIGQAAANLYALRPACPRSSSALDMPPSRSTAGSAPSRVGCEITSSRVSCPWRHLVVPEITPT
jgi:hypothetical protein